MTDQGEEFWKGYDQYGNPKQQETQVNETEENPAVSKLREAFDTAANAILKGTELAKQVEELTTNVASLQEATRSLNRDLEYIRNRNRELDEQVTEVRRQRDAAHNEGMAAKERAERAEASLASAREVLAHQDNRIDQLQLLLNNAVKERDDALTMALEYEGKFKEAAAKLAKIEEVFGTSQGGGQANVEVAKPVPHYEVQPRDEVGKFQPMTYPQGSQSRSEDPQS